MPKKWPYHSWLYRKECIMKRDTQSNKLNEILQIVFLDTNTQSWIKSKSGRIISWSQIGHDLLQIACICTCFISIHGTEKTGQKNNKIMLSGEWMKKGNQNFLHNYFLHVCLLFSPKFSLANSQKQTYLQDFSHTSGMIAFFLFPETSQALLLTATTFQNVQILACWL